MSQPRSVTILVAALGGEGGSVLADWIVSAATLLNFPVQSTSVPGVAQRTGATNYYIEVFPVSHDELGGREPVMSLAPTIGDINFIAATELVEAGRALQSGYANQASTVLVASSHREFSVAEKVATADGRFESEQILEAAKALTANAIVFDMRTIAWEIGTVINTVLFGAMAGSGSFPLTRDACEEAIRRSGKSVETSLKGFKAGWEYASSGAHGKSRVSEKISTLPAAANDELKQITSDGINLTTDYQDAAYASAYLEGVERVSNIEKNFHAKGSLKVSKEVARHLALLMSYEDVIRVAELKTRRTRLDRLRKEFQRDGKSVLRITEHLKPGFDDITSMLPVSLAKLARSLFPGMIGKGHRAMRLRSDTVIGFSALRMLSLLKPTRRWSLRFQEEQSSANRWLNAIELALPLSAELAYEIAASGNLLKGYGQTRARGDRALEAIVEYMEANEKADPVALNALIRKFRIEVETNPDKCLTLQSGGIQSRQPKSQPIKFFRPKRIGVAAS
jgi:indolepyruvate ferredoxin oxidoreductase beta subunit